MGIKTSKSDIIWSYLGYFFSYATNLIIILLVMSKISVREIGLWYTFLSIGALAYILDFGISTTLVRNITYAWSGAESIEKEGYLIVEGGDKCPNYKLLNRIINSCKMICLIIGLLAFTILISVGTVYINYVSKGLDNSHYLLSWFIYSVAVFLNIYYTFWITSLRGIGAIKESQVATVLARTAQILVSIIGVYFKSGILALAVAYLVYGFVLRIASRYYLFRFKNLGSELRAVNEKYSVSILKDIFITIWYNAKKVGIVSLSTYLIQQSTIIVCSMYLGLSETASYGLCLQIFTAIAGLAQIYFQAEVPMLINLKVKNEVDEIRKRLSKSMVIYWVVYLVATLAVITLGIPILKVLKSNVNLPVNMAIFMSLYMFLEYNHSLFATYISMSNTIPYLRASVVSGITIMFLSFAVGILGGNIYWLISVKCMVQLCYNNWKWPKVVMSELELTTFKMIEITITTTKSVLQKNKKYTC